MSNIAQIPSSLLALLLLIAAFTPIVSADLHYNAMCVNQTGGYNVYSASGTAAACAAYLARDTGDEVWDTCPDCTMVGGDAPHCSSAEQHIGGDEFDYYCNEQNGLASLAS